MKPQTGDIPAAGAASALWQHDVRRCGGQGVVRGLGDTGSHRCGVLGIDEAGRGSWVGPVVAAAAFLTQEAYRDTDLMACAALIDDSKKLTPQRRAEVYLLLCQWQRSGLIRIAAGRAEVEEIEAHNVVGATALAMQRAVAALQLPFALPSGAGVKVGGKRRQAPVAAAPHALPLATHTANRKQKRVAAKAVPSPSQTELTLGQTDLKLPVATITTDTTTTGVDSATVTTGVASATAASGIPVSAVAFAEAADAPPSAGGKAETAAASAPFVWIDGLPLTGRVPWAHEGIVSGDAISFAIAMASIYAKVTRDRLLEQLGQAFPQYGWGTNYGYGTPAHQAALRAHGRCRHHRPKFLQKLGL